MRQFFVIVDRAAHDGRIYGPVGRADWERGLRFQDMTAPHGMIYTGGADDCDRDGGFATLRRAKVVLAEYLQCNAPETGAYCYTHNPSGR